MIRNTMELATYKILNTLESVSHKNSAQKDVKHSNDNLTKHSNDNLMMG